MKSTLKALPVVIAASVLMLVGCTSIPGLSTLMKAPSVTGDWMVSGNDVVYNMALVEDGDRITGTFGLSLFIMPLKGMRKANKLDLTYETPAIFNNATASIPIIGDISADGKRITGTIATSSFTAIKK